MKLNKKVAQLAFRRAFSEKIAADAVRVLDTLNLPEAKTRLFATLLKSLKITGPGPDARVQVVATLPGGSHLGRLQPRLVHPTSGRSVFRTVIIKRKYHEYIAAVYGGGAGGYVRGGSRYG